MCWFLLTRYTISIIISTIIIFSCVSQYALVPEPLILESDINEGGSFTC